MDACSEMRLPEERDPPGSSVRRSSAQARTCRDILPQPYVHGHMFKNRSDREHWGVARDRGSTPQYSFSAQPLFSAHPLAIEGACMTTTLQSGALAEIGMRIASAIITASSGHVVVNKALCQGYL